MWVSSNTRGKGKGDSPTLNLALQHQQKAPTLKHSPWTREQEVGAAAITEKVRESLRIPSRAGKRYCSSEAHRSDLEEVTASSKVKTADARLQGAQNIKETWPPTNTVVFPCPTPGKWRSVICLPNQFSSVAQSCPTLWDPMNCSTLGLPVHHQLPEFTQTHVHWVSDAIQPSHPLSSPSSPALNLSLHQRLFKWVSSSHQVAKVLEFQLQHQSFQWTPRTDLL